MALAYLLSPTFQFVNTAGHPLTGGYLEVYIAGSRNKYYCASDFNGTLHPFRIPLDSLGANVVLADDGHSYDVYVYNRYGGLSMSRYNVNPGEGGGISGDSITSSDGSIIVTPTADGVDLKVNAKPPTVMRCTATDLTGDGAFQFSELQRDGTSARVDSYTVKIDEGWWHFDAVARLRWSGEANGTQSVSLYTANGSDSMTFDMSYPHSETVSISGELKAEQDGTSFVLGVLGVPVGMTVSLVDFGIHSIVGEGAGGKYNAGDGIIIDETNRVISIDPDEVQEKLTPGPGINIDNDGVISVDESAISGIFPVTYNVTTFNEIRTALIAGKLPVLFRNDPEEFAVSIQRIPIHELFDGGTYKYAQFWTPYIYSSPSAAYPPYADFEVWSASYDTGSGTTTWSTLHKYFAEQSDWAEADAKKLTFIKNKPDLSVYVTNSALATTLADYVTDSELETILDGYVTAGDLQEAIAGVRQVPASTAQDATKVLTVDSNGDPAWAPAQAPISAGDGISISNNVVSAKVDGTTITTNSSGELEAVSAVPPMKELVAGNNITLTENANDVTVACSVTIGTVTV